MADQTTSASKVGDVKAIPKRRQAKGPNPYAEHVKALVPGGHLDEPPLGSVKAVPVKDEKEASAVRSDLYAAASNQGRTLRTKLVDNVVYFWIKPDTKQDA